MQTKEIDKDTLTIYVDGTIITINQQEKVSTIIVQSIKDNNIKYIQPTNDLHYIIMT